MIIELFKYTDRLWKKNQRQLISIFEEECAVYITEDFSGWTQEVLEESNQPISFENANKVFCICILIIATNNPAKEILRIAVKANITIWQIQLFRAELFFKRLLDKEAFKLASVAISRAVKNAGG